ncbi:glycoside hydrolase superfamily [Apodospora peruviana]|uniref:Glycoside hydrolase superfamily n=1 Tax=Apodospora peruviana TaxID=516989 RepID=A0AAE0IJ08_9PEZI|nr:glycoside hydrolase superfamily [Apodospora peruviana]
MRFQPSLVFLLAAAPYAAAYQDNNLKGYRPHRRAACACSTATFGPVSAREWFNAANPGWNAGNSLDALPDEGSWNNVPLQESTFDDVKDAGFKSVRIPVTYAEHFVRGSPNWTINATWLQRVSDVIDMATARGLYVITNMHHGECLLLYRLPSFVPNSVVIKDSWNWADVSKPNANQTLIREKFSAAWLQIAEKLACKPATVAFEPINEPAGSTETDSENLMKLNDLFLAALQESGGFNPQRVVTLSGLGMSGDKVHMFKKPGNMTNPWAFQFHYYSPYDFTFAAWGKTIWGSASDKAAVVSDLSAVRGNFSSDIPIVMGEFDASQLQCEAAARWKWFDHVVRTATSLGITSMVWDNGLDNLDRATGQWRDKIAVDITVNAVKGVTNSLADSTIDASATNQDSSAYIFNKVGSELADRTLSFILNGNSFKSLSVGTDLLEEGKDYTSSSSGAVTFKRSFLANYLSATAAPGTKANVTVTFSAGSPSQVELVQWDTPVLGALASAANDVPVGADLQVPVVWKGLHRVAAVKIVRGDGAYLVDDWTQWLPELQKGRGTLASQWNFDYDRVTITRAAVDAVIASGKNTAFTFEFYPRAAGNGNYINYTLTV